MFLCFVHPLSGRSKKKDHCLNEKLYPLEETETCPCDEFLSQPYGNWSACILPDPSAPGSLKGWMSHREVKECGQGLRYRAVACIDQQGHLVNPTLCTDSGRTKYKLWLLWWPFTSPRNMLISLWTATASTWHTSKETRKGGYSTACLQGRLSNTNQLHRMKTLQYSKNIIETIVKMYWKGHYYSLCALLYCCDIRCVYVGEDLSSDLDDHSIALFYVRGQAMNCINPLDQALIGWLFLHLAETFTPVGSIPDLMKSQNNSQMLVPFQRSRTRITASFLLFLKN